ncbi:MAG: hypothetical protein JXM71_01805, partial [Spirochaetales bacterium]|nr:hypothetical protein [Spirochaetales bacterium]
MLRDQSGTCYIQPGENFSDCAATIAERHEGEFSLYPELTADTVEAAAAARFMPMGISLWTAEGSKDFLLPKLHLERCLLDPARVHITKTARREARRYLLSVNESFDAVLASCVLTHGDDWLVPTLVAAFRRLHEERATRRVRMVSVELWPVSGDSSAPVAGAPVAGAPVAGEIGYLIGRAYASLTGFSRVSGAGTVQLSALGALLSGLGVTLWDLGMEIDYKTRLGGHVEARDTYLPALLDAYASDGAHLDYMVRGMKPVSA